MTHVRDMKCLQNFDQERIVRPRLRWEGGS